VTAVFVDFDGNRRASDTPAALHRPTRKYRIPVANLPVAATAAAGGPEWGEALVGPRRIG